MIECKFCSRAFLLFMDSNWAFNIFWTDDVIWWFFSTVLEAFQNPSLSFLWAFPDPFRSCNCLGLRYNIDSSWNVWSCKCTWTNSLPHWQEWACLHSSLVMSINSLLRFSVFSQSEELISSRMNFLCFLFFLNFHFFPRIVIWVLSYEYKS